MRKVRTSVTPSRDGRRCRKYLLLVALSTLIVSHALGRAKEKVIYRFAGAADGAYPSSSLTMDNSGNLYGTTAEGGIIGCYGIGCGVVFQLKPTAGGRWVPNVIHAFQPEIDGTGPSGNLVFDASGNLYGTTAEGGAYKCGTAFELSPDGSGMWKETILHNFGGSSDGCDPEGLTLDAEGNLYGVTGSGGSLIYELSPPEQPGGEWTETILYDMGFGNWAAPDLAFDTMGNIHDTWYPNFCCGGVFELTRIGVKNWQKADLYDFPGGGNGGEPESGVLLVNNGHMFGTTFTGGNDQGLVFEMKRSGHRWKTQILYMFCSLNYCADGAYPDGPLVRDDAGNLYGVTNDGGTRCGRFRCGVVFKLAPGKIEWKETVLHRFQGSPDGNEPTRGLVSDGKGHLYGATILGGNDGPNGGFGAVFEVSP